MFLKNRNIISKIRRSKITDYAALTEMFQNNLINVSYLMACYLYQVMMTLHFLNDVANDQMMLNNTTIKNYVIIASLKSV